MARSQANLDIVATWVEASSWVDFLAENPATRSSTSICLHIVDEWATGRDSQEIASKTKALAKLLDAEGIAFDIGSYRDAPPGLRLWGGATVEASDLAALLPWLDWAWSEVRSKD